MAFMAILYQKVFDENLKINIHFIPFVKYSVKYLNDLTSTTWNHILYDNDLTKNVWTSD